MALCGLRAGSTHPSSTHTALPRPQASHSDRSKHRRRSLRRASRRVTVHLNRSITRRRQLRGRAGGILRVPIGRPADVHGRMSVRDRAGVDVVLGDRPPLGMPVGEDEIGPVVVPSGYEEAGVEGDEYPPAVCGGIIGRAPRPVGIGDDEGLGRILDQRYRQCSFGVSVPGDRRPARRGGCRLAP